MAKIVDPDLLADSAADDGSTEVYINTATKTIKLVVTGDLSNTGVQNENGVTLKALYSFLKEEWRLDEALAESAGRRVPRGVGRRA